MMKYVKLYGDLSGIVDDLSDQEAGRLFKAVLAYALSGKSAPLPGPEKLVFKMLLAQFQRDRESYAEMVEQNRLNGKKGGRPRQTAQSFTGDFAAEKPDGFSENRKKAKKTQDKEKEKDEDQDKDQDEDEEAPAPARVGFAPPSPQDVRAYCQENRFDVDPQRFCDFYASKGWRVGQQPMVDWRAAIRAWARSEPRGAPTAPRKAVGHQQYAQRAYENNFNALDAMMKRFQEEGLS